MSGGVTMNQRAIKRKPSRKQRGKCPKLASKDGCACRNGQRAHGIGPRNRFSDADVSEQRGQHLAVVGAPWSRKRPDNTPAIEFTELNLCYFAALCGALQVIDDKARSKGVFRIDPVTGHVSPSLNMPAIERYVAIVGDRIAKANGIA